FSLLDQLLLRMLPVRNPAEFVQLAGRGSHYGSNWGMDAMSYPMYRDFRDKAPVFSGVVCRRGFVGSLGHNGQVERARVELVSGNYFQVLGVGALLGRTLLPEDDARAGAHPVVVLAYDYWRSRFGGDPAVLNRAVILNDAPFTVLGVAAEGFFGMQVGDAAQVFVPMMMQERIVPNIKLLEERRTRFVNVFARLRPGVTLEQARAAVAPLYKQIIEMEVQEAAFARASREAKDRFLQSTMAVFPGATGISPLRRQFSAPVYVLMTLVGFVLSIACANVANLQLARATARQREIAVRLAVGASRGQIVRQLLVESVTLALAAGAAGLLLARWSVGLLLGAFPPEISRLTITADLDRRLLLFNFAVSVLVGIVFGVAPALQATRPDLASTLKEEGGGLAGGTHARLRKTLVVAQVGLSLLLLVGAGLFVHSLYNLRTLDPGFRTEKLVREEIRSVPGVLTASCANMPVVSGDEWDSSITVEGHDPTKGSNAWAYMNHVLPGYFGTMGAALAAGRDFTWNDTSKSAKVCIVNERFVREYFPGRDPIGRRVGMGSDPGTKTDIEIVGVVRDFKYQNMRETIGRQMYRPYPQMEFALSMWFYARTSLEPEATFGAIRSRIRGLDPNLPVYGMRTLDAQIERNLATDRLVAALSACFGALATLLAVIGLYGVMAYLVGRRSREIGIRMALGAQARSVVWLVMRDVLLLVTVGLALGLAGALGLARLVRAQLFGVAPNDARVMAAATVGLAAVALLAGFLPARRASRLDPLRVLRHE
ncbi:MAG: multidrug ABC transporter substrate-binding protein, partial [Acidobacteria bacterium]